MQTHGHPYIAHNARATPSQQDDPHPQTYPTTISPTQSTHTTKSFASPHHLLWLTLLLNPTTPALLAKPPKKAQTTTQLRQRIAQKTKKGRHNSHRWIYSGITLGSTAIAILLYLTLGKHSNKPNTHHTDPTTQPSPQPTENNQDTILPSTDTDPNTQKAQQDPPPNLRKQNILLTNPKQQRTKQNPTTNTNGQDTILPSTDTDPNTQKAQQDPPPKPHDQNILLTNPKQQRTKQNLTTNTNNQDTILPSTATDPNTQKTQQDPPSNLHKQNILLTNPKQQRTKQNPTTNTKPKTAPPQPTITADKQENTHTYLLPKKQFKTLLPQLIEKTCWPLAAIPQQDKKLVQGPSQPLKNEQPRRHKQKDTQPKRYFLHHVIDVENSLKLSPLIVIIVKKNSFLCVVGIAWQASIHDKDRIIVCCYAKAKTEQKKQNKKEKNKEAKQIITSCKELAQQTLEQSQAKELTEFKGFKAP